MNEFVALDPSRCLRMRFNGNKCDKCLACCRSDAIALTPALALQHDQCTGCMLCTSVCPAEALIPNQMNVPQTLEKLKRTSNPVLSCNRQPDLQAHEKTACLGWLGEEYLLALGWYLPDRLQLNLTACSDCQNGFIVDRLKKLPELVRTKTALDVSNKISLIEQRSELEYRETPYNRRNFFHAMKTRITRGISDTLIFDSPKQKGSAYNRKTLPSKRKILNHVVEGSSGKLKENLLTNYYYKPVIEPHCSLCLVCAAICPTGALHTNAEQGEARLVCDPYCCSGCQLCAECCREDAIHLKTWEAEAYCADTY